MKHFKLNGNTAYWKHGLNFEALNLNTLENNITSPIPAGKRMWVNVVSNLQKTEDEMREVLKGEISESDKSELLSQIKNNTPDFILSLGGKVIGYANLHNRKNCAKGQTEETTKESRPKVDISQIVDDNLTMLIIPIEGASHTTKDDIAALAELRKKLSSDTGTERIAIIDHSAHTLYIEDIPIPILEEKYNGEEEDYIADNYTFSGEYSWDFITDVEYTPNDGETYSIEPSDFVD
jgi:hypothetical protein